MLRFSKKRSETCDYTDNNRRQSRRWCDGDNRSANRTRDGYFSFPLQDWNTLLRMEEEYIEKMCAEVRPPFVCWSIMRSWLLCQNG